MDDYDPACPTEDDNQFVELDLSQVPLPPSYPAQGEDHSRDTSSSLVPAELDREESKKGRKKKKKRRRHGGSRTHELEPDEGEDKEDDDVKEQSLITGLPAAPLSSEGGDETPTVEPVSESDHASKVNLNIQDPPSTLIQPQPAHSSSTTASSSSSSVPTIVNPSASVSNSDKLLFKLTPNPTGGKAKVSFQLKKSLKSAFQVAEENEEVENVVEEEGKEIVEKTAAGEYIPTRFKVSKKHEMFRPGQLESNITVVFNSSLINTGGSSAASVAKAELNVSPPSLTNLRDTEAIVVSDLTDKDSVVAVKDVKKDKSTKSGREIKSSEEEYEGGVKSKDEGDSQKGLRRSERRDGKKENKSTEKDDSSRSTRQSGKREDRDVDRHESPRSSSSRRDRDEIRKKDKSDASSRRDMYENYDRRRSSRTRKNESATKNEEKKSSDRKPEEHDGGDKNDSRRKSSKLEDKSSPKHEDKPSPNNSRSRGGIRTRNSQRSRSTSFEKDGKTCSSPIDSLISLPPKTADPEDPESIDVTSIKVIESESSGNEYCDKKIREATSVIIRREEPAIIDKDLKSVAEDNNTSTDETAEGHPHIQKIVIRRSVDSNDFEIAKNDLSDKNTSGDSFSSRKQNLVASKTIQVSLQRCDCSSDLHDEKLDSSEKDNINISEKEILLKKEAPKSVAQQRYTKERVQHRLLSSEDETPNKLTSDELVVQKFEKSSDIAESEKLPEKIAEPEKFPEKIAESKKFPEKIAEPEKFHKKIAEPEKFPEKIAEPEKFPEKIAEPEEFLEKIAESEKFPEKIAEPEKFPEKIAESEKFPEKIAEPEKFHEKIAGPQKFHEKITESEKIPEKISEPQKLSETIFEPQKLHKEISKLQKLPEKIDKLEKLPEKIVEPTKLQEKCAEPQKLLEKIVEPKKLAEKIVEPKKLQKKSTESQKLLEKIVEPKKLTEKTVEPKKLTEKIIEPKKLTEKIVKPKKLQEKNTEPQKLLEKIVEPKKLTENRAEPQKLAEKISEPQKLPERSSYIPEPPLLPEQVLVDVSALPGKSKWEMDDDDDDDDDILVNSAGRNEDRLPVRDFRTSKVSSRWSYHTQVDSTRQTSHRVRKITESSSNEDDEMQEHKRYKDNKKDKTDKITKKKKQEYISAAENVESKKVSEETEEYRRKGESSRSRVIIDNSKIINYLKEYSSQEEKSLRARAEIDSSKLVTYLKEYSGKMKAESALHGVSVLGAEVMAGDALLQKRKTKEESSLSEGNKAGLDILRDSYKDKNPLPEDSTSHKQKEQGSGDLKAYHTEKSTKINKRGDDEKLEEKDFKNKRYLEPSRSRSSSNERSQKDKSTERLLKGRDRSSSQMKEKRARSSSADGSERSGSKTSQRSKDKRDRSRSVEKNRRSKRNRSRSTERQDHSRSTDRRQGRRQSRSRSPAWRSRDRRNRSRSVSPDRRNDRRERSWSRSRERNYSYRSHKSPDNYGRSRRDYRVRRRRSRSNSLESTSGVRRHDSEDSPTRYSRHRKKSKSPEKRLSPIAKPDSERSSNSGQSSKIKLEAVAPLDLSSIPIPDDIPLPGEKAQKNLPEKEEESKLTQDAVSSDVLRDESMDVSDEEKKVMKIESRVRSTKDLEITEVCTEKKSVSLPENVLKENTASKSDHKIQNVNPATLSSGKDRHIKFSIMGASRRLKSVVLSDMLGDDSEVDNNELLVDKCNVKPQILAEDVDVSEYDQYDGSKTNNTATEDTENDEGLQMVGSEKSMRISNVNSDLASLPKETNKVSEPKPTDSHHKIGINTEELNTSPMIISDGENETVISSLLQEKNTDTSSSSSQKEETHSSSSSQKKETDSSSSSSSSQKEETDSYSSSQKEETDSSSSSSSSQKEETDSSSSSQKEETDSSSSSQKEETDSSSLPSQKKETYTSSSPSHKKGKDIPYSLLKIGSDTPFSASQKRETDASLNKETDSPPQNKEIDSPSPSPQTKEIDAPSTSPQRLKFKYTPLWELEESERKSVTEEISKKSESSCGLALDYGSDSSDSEGEDNSIIKNTSIGKLREDELKGIESSDTKCAIDQVQVQEITTVVADSAEGLINERDLQLSTKDELDIKTETSHQMLTYVNVECPDSETAELPLQKQNSSVILLEEDKEAYSPSHPSMEDTDDLFDVVATTTTKNGESASVDKTIASSKTPGKSNDLKIMSSVSSIGATPTLTSTLKNVASLSLTALPLPNMLQPISSTFISQTSQASIKPLGVSQTTITSLVGKPLPGLQIPLPHSSLLAPTLSFPQPVPPPSTIQGIQLPNIPLPQSVAAPKPVPPPQLSTTLSQSFGVAALSSSSPFTATVQVISSGHVSWDNPVMPLKTEPSFPGTGAAQGISSQVLGVQGTLGIQAATLSGLRGIAPVPVPAPEIAMLASVSPVPPPSIGVVLGGTLPSVRVLPGGELPATGGVPGGILPSVTTLLGCTFPAIHDGAMPSMSPVVQSTPTSIVKVEGTVSSVLQQQGTTNDAVTSSVPAVKYRINRFHQGPSGTQAIPPPSVAIPLPTLALPSVLGTSAAVTNIPTTVPFTSSLLQVQQPTMSEVLASTLPKPVGTKQQSTSSVVSKKSIASDQLVTTTTHSKRPKISSILSQPKVQDLTALEASGVMDVKGKPLSATSEDLSAKSQSLIAHGMDMLHPDPNSPLPSDKQPAPASDSAAQKTKLDTVLSTESSSQCHNQLSQDTIDVEDTDKLLGTIAKDGSIAKPAKLQSQPSSEDIKSNVTTKSNSLEGQFQEQVSTSFQAPELDMDDIPLPGEVPSTMEAQASPSIIPKSSSKTGHHLPSSSTPKHLPPPAAVSDSNSSVASSKDPSLGSLLSERKKRFSQSPLAIGMLPRVQITQSPLAAGPLPKLPPDPEENKNSASLTKKRASSPLVAEAKSITQLSLATKQKTPQVEKEATKSTSKVHFVFKSKVVVQKTLISAFEDEGSDESEDEHQETSNEPSHFENSILSVFADDGKETPPPSSTKSVTSAAITGIKKQAPASEKDGTRRDSDVGRDQKPKVVTLTDIEAFPVQVITSSRKEEITPASSWPEFTVGKKGKRDEEVDKDGKRRSRDREDKSKRRSRYSRERERDDDRDERKRRKRYEGEEDKRDVTRRKIESRRSDDDDDDNYDGRIIIKKEKDDYYEFGQSSGQDDRNSDQNKSCFNDEDGDRRKDSDRYSKRRNRYDGDENDYRRGKSRDGRDEKYSRRRSEDDRDDDHNRRKYDDDSRRGRHVERDRSRDRSRERGRSSERDRSERSSGKSGGKRNHRSRDRSHSRSKSRSPSRRKGRAHSRDRYDRIRDRDRSRSHSSERGSSSRRKDSRSFKEELLEELAKPSNKTDLKDDLFKVASISSSSQSYTFDYPIDTTYSSTTDANLYSVAQHGPELASGYLGQDPNCATQYQPAYEHQQYGPQWPGQPAHNAYSQVPPSQHQDIHGQYPPVLPEQMAASHPYPFQPHPSHYPQPSYPSSHNLAETYHPVPSILQQQQQQLPQMQHPVSGPHSMHLQVDQHGQPIPPQYPAIQHQQVPPSYTPSLPTHFHPHTFSQEPLPPFTPDFQLGLRPRAPLLPNLIRGSLLRSPLVSHNLVDTSSIGSPRFSSPEAVSSPGQQRQPELRPPKKSRFGPLEEGTFSPVIKSSAATSSFPTTRSPLSNMNKSEALYKKSLVEDASFGSSNIPEPSFETSLLAETEFDSTVVQQVKKSSGVSLSKKKSTLEVNEPTVSSSGVEDSTGDTGSDSGTDSSTQRPLKVKSRWRRNSEAEAVVDTSTPLAPITKQLLNQSSTPNDTPDSSPKERRRTRSRAAAEEFICVAAPLTETPPPPPPPRKRIKVESEMTGTSEEQENEDRGMLQEIGNKDLENEEQDLASLMLRPDFPRFEIITENIHLTERKRSKSMKRMLCDCTTSREDRAKGIVACGSDCLNRMLMIECGSRCPCGEHCTNKRFQKKQYSLTIPFKAGDKGWGLRAEEDMEEKGTFIMEYVGELLDYEEFVRRTRQYSKIGLVHHYFMALNADEVVDATLRGSISRFINHSCDPNCETQKWTVNGELRVGFFTRKSIKKGEELTFDYQFEHYGEAQKCYCGAENCRGYIGLVKSPTRNNRRKEKKKKEIFKDELLEEDIEELSLLDGMRNKNHVLDLCRLMVRAEKVQHRMAILKILQDTTESACLRLFLDYHGLPLFWSWMADIGTSDYSAQTQELKLLMLSVLKSLPITNKTALRESKIPDVVERWAFAAVVAAKKPPPPPPPTSATTTTINKATDSITYTATSDNEAVAVSETAITEDDVVSVEDNEKTIALEPEATNSSESSPPASPSPLLPPLLSTITPVSILASAKDSKEAKRKRRVTFAEVPVESAFSPEPIDEAEESDDISSSTQGAGEKEGLDDVRIPDESRSSSSTGQLALSDVPGEAAASGDKGFKLEEGKFDLKSDEILSSHVADSTSMKYNFDNSNNSGTASDADNSDTETLIKDPLASLAAECVSLWSSLKEVFKIPKRERVEERKRTERELDVLYKKDQETSDPYAKWKRNRVMRLSKKKTLEDDERKLNAPRMSKAERRQLFEAKVKKEDEMAAQAFAEEYQRQQEAYMLHQQRLLDDPQYFYYHQQHQGDPNFAGIDPSMIPPEGLTDPITGQPIPGETLIDIHIGQPLIDPNTGQPIIDPNTGQPIIDGNTGQPLMHHPSQIDPSTGLPIMHQHHIDPQTGHPVQHLDPVQHSDSLTGQLVQHLDPHTGQPLQHMDPHTGQPLQHIDPHTGQPLQHMDPHTAQPLQHMDPHTGQPLQHMDPHTGQPLQHIDQLTGQLVQHLDPHTGQPVHQIDPITGQPVITSQIDPTTGQPLQHQMDQLMTHPNIQPVHSQFDLHSRQPVQHQHPLLGQTAAPNFQQQQLLPATTQNKSLLEIDLEEEVPPPPSPPTVPVSKLPPNWKTAKDSEGRIYYYHAFTRQTQWEMPGWDENDDDSDDMDLDPIPVDEVIKVKKKTTTAAADTSSEVARKIKDQFRSKMSNFIVTYLNPYRKQDCKIGRIVSTDDFKHLARKLTHHVMSKELKHCRHVEDLEVNENVKAKAKDYVRKYMSKFGSTFKKSSSPHPDESTV